MVEGLVALVPLSLLFLAIPLVGKWQDIGLRTQHAGRYAAFDAVQRERAPPELTAEVERRFFYAPEAAAGSTPVPAAPAAPALWVDARAAPLLSDTAGRITVDVGSAAAAESLGSTRALPLLRALDLPVEGVLTSRVTAQGASLTWPGLGNGTGAALRFERKVALLRFGGAVEGDAAAQSRLDDAVVYPGTRSRQIAEPLVRELSLIDRGWGWRPGAQWLEPWTGLVPADRLGPVTSERAP